jgi:hypothetical protein
MHHAIGVAHGFADRRGVEEVEFFVPRHRQLVARGLRERT